MAVEAFIRSDSISPRGDRLTTIEGEFWRPMLSENNTHRGLTKNSASSRAIPVQKQLARVMDDPAMPLVWASEVKGMQAGPPLEGRDLVDAQAMVQEIYGATTSIISRYITSHPLESGPRLHKSLINRYLEPFMWHRIVQSGTDAMWDNFFKLRSTTFTTKAQPEMAAFADAIYEAMQTSEPEMVGWGSWHTPFIDTSDDFGWVVAQGGRQQNVIEAMKMVATGRLCRVSYLTHDGKRDMREDIKLFSRLATERPIHASPLEHVATPTEPTHDPRPGNFHGWGQYRHFVEEEIELLGDLSAEEYVLLKLGGAA